MKTDSGCVVDHSPLVRVIEVIGQDGEVFVDSGKVIQMACLTVDGVFNEFIVGTVDHRIPLLWCGSCNILHSLSAVPVPRCGTVLAIYLLLGTHTPTAPQSFVYPLGTTIFSTAPRGSPDRKS